MSSDLREALERLIEALVRSTARELFADDVKTAVAFARQALASIPVNKDEAPCTDCDDTGIAFQTERACTCEAGRAYATPDQPVTGDGVEDVVERVAITDQDREAAQPFDRYLRGANSLGNLRYAFAKHRHAALSAAKPVPDGMVMVPREPTEAMVNAYGGAMNASRHNGSEWTIRDAYRALLSPLLTSKDTCP